MSKLPTYIWKIIVITLSFGLALPVNQIQAVTILTAAQSVIDTTIIKEDTAFTSPSKIVIVPISLPNNDSNVSGRDWARGLYYYLVANESRPGFTDIPFHYIVSADGTVFKGNQGGDERKVAIDGVSGSPIVIAYLSFKKQINFDVRAETSLVELITEVANRNVIPPSEITLAGLTLSRNDSEKIIKLTKTDTIGTWQTSLNKMIEVVRSRYAPQTRQYNIQINSVTLPAEGVNPGTPVTGKISITNKGDKGLYGDTNTELIATAKNVGRESRFYITGDWLSTTQFGFMPEGGSIPAGGTAEFEFKFYVPLFFGRQEEEFELRTVSGQVVANSTFKAGLNINRPAGTIVQIRNTEVGFLRLRSGPSGLVNNEIGRVYQGERYFQINDAGNGYIQIKLPDGRTGWISKGYVSYI